MITNPKLLIACENLHEHVSKCGKCHEDQTSLCPIGNQLNEFAAKLRDEIEREEKCSVES